MDKVIIEELCVRIIRLNPVPLISNLRFYL